ncbi:MAG TPA: CdaR family protein [Kiritimatiellia bacterium]|nr:CdaR family protein [Kiritimatiellia bacterium]HRZ13149.1 CdaR family protein [Kiritimatiellia bacterium]HSA17570.1 CdaR family protein [Kiritimatiellia bacterium]
MPSWASRLAELLRRNWGGKLAALVLATVTWYGIQSVINFEARIREVPVTLRLPEGWAALDQSVSAVDIVFRGSEEDIRFLNRDQIKVEIDLNPRAIKGTNLVARFKILPRHISAPNTVRPVQVRPDEITVSLDRQEQKAVPVKADFQGEPAEEFEVERWECAPAAVTLSGPHSRLQRIESVNTIALDLEGRTKSFRKTHVPVQAPPETVVVEPVPAQVSVEVSLAERTSTETWKDVPVCVLSRPGAREELSVVPVSATLTVRGRAEILKKLDARDVRVYADGSDVEKAGTYELPLRIHPPPGLAVVKTEPPVVSVTWGEP